eukprot:TRINITY_DN8633_c0_g1_i2.p1 TRINITY_DN8633_c0_g1~~TRINITY_DN8633_c0_g1_i2.p1  ORF type:complete len:282 (+),score=22.00 TRINITY_DN8633_c0_g1_i2:393-1238(+)
MTQACRNRGVKRLILTSSIAVYFPSTHERQGWFPPTKKRVILDENSPRAPDDFWVNYCRTKCIQEKIVQASDLDYIILQPSDIIGKHDDRSWGRLIRMMAECRLVGIPRTKLNFVNVTDVAEGHFRAAVYGTKGETYILGGCPFQTTELISEMMANIRRILGVSTCAPKAVPLLLLSLLGCVQEWFDDDPLDSQPNAPEADKSFPRETIFLLSSQHTTCSDKAAKAFGYQPTTHAGVIEAVREMADTALSYNRCVPPPTGLASIRHKYHLTKHQLHKLLNA